MRTIYLNLRLFYWKHAGMDKVFIKCILVLFKILFKLP